MAVSIIYKKITTKSGSIKDAISCVRYKSIKLNVKLIAVEAQIL